MVKCEKFIYIFASSFSPLEVISFIKVVIKLYIVVERVDFGRLSSAESTKLVIITAHVTTIHHLIMVLLLLGHLLFHFLGFAVSHA